MNNIYLSVLQQKPALSWFVNTDYDFYLIAVNNKPVWVKIPSDANNFSWLVKPGKYMVDSPKRGFITISLPYLRRAVFRVNRFCMPDGTQVRGWDWVLTD